MYAKGLDARTLLHDLGLQPRDIMAWMQRQRPEVRRPLNIKAPVGHRLQLNGRIIQWIRSKRDHVPDQYLQAISISPLLPETLQARYCSSTQVRLTRLSQPLIRLMTVVIDRWETRTCVQEA